MTFTDFAELYKMIDLIVNEGDQIFDFVIDNSKGAIWITLKSGQLFEFIATYKK